MHGMHNDSMSSAVALLHQIDWIKNEIETQVDAGIENFTLVESGEGKLLEFCKVVVNSVVGNYAKTEPITEPRTRCDKQISV